MSSALYNNDGQPIILLVESGMVFAHEPRSVGAVRPDVHFAQVFDGVGEGNDIIPVPIIQPHADGSVQEDSLVLGNGAAIVDGVHQGRTGSPLERVLVLQDVPVDSKVFDDAIVVGALQDIVELRSRCRPVDCLTLNKPIED